MSAVGAVLRYNQVNARGEDAPRSKIARSPEPSKTSAAVILACASAGTAACPATIVALEITEPPRTDSTGIGFARRSCYTVGTLERTCLSRPSRLQFPEPVSLQACAA